MPNRVEEYLQQIKDIAGDNARKASKKIARDIERTPEHVRQMNQLIRRELPKGVQINRQADDGSAAIYADIQKRLGGLTIEGEKVYDTKLLDAHTQSVVFSKYPLDDHRVHEYFQKTKSSLLPDLMVHSLNEPSLTFKVVGSGDSLRVSLAKSDQRKHIANILAEKTEEVRDMLSLNPSHAEAIVATIVEKNFRDPKRRAALQSALSDIPEEWEGRVNKEGLTVEDFAEKLAQQGVAEYIAFCFKGSDTGVQYGLAQSYMATFRRFAPLVVTVRMEHFIDMYEANPLAFSKEYRQEQGKQIPVLRFDAGYMSSGEIWDSYLAKPNVQLLSPIPSGMFIQHAGLYGKQEELIRYGRIKRVKHERHFYNSEYNFVRRRLFRGYDNY